jgi:hypothetical protein
MADTYALFVARSGRVDGINGILQCLYYQDAIPQEYLRGEIIKTEDKVEFQPPIDNTNLEKRLTEMAHKEEPKHYPNYTEYMIVKTLDKELIERVAPFICTDYSFRWDFYETLQPITMGEHSNPLKELSYGKMEVKPIHILLYKGKSDKWGARDTKE